MSLKTAMKLRLSVHCMVDRNMRESIVCAFAWNGWLYQDNLERFYQGEA